MPHGAEHGIVFALIYESCGVESAGQTAQTDHRSTVFFSPAHDRAAANQLFGAANQQLLTSCPENSEN